MRISECGPGVWVLPASAAEDVEGRQSRQSTARNTCTNVPHAPPPFQSLKLSRFDKLYFSKHTTLHTHRNIVLRPPQVSAINTAMSSLIKTLNVFPRERLIVNRERAKQVRGWVYGF